MRYCLPRLLASLVFAAFSGAAGAQQAGDQTGSAAPVQQVAPSVLIVDLERFYAQSLFGERVSQINTDARIELNAENRRIATALREEELALADQRSTMDPEVFRTEAEAFDEKTQGIRRAQDAKENALEELLAQGQAQFLDVSRPILEQLMVDRGATAILDRRSVLLWSGSIDVTDIAISRINDVIGDGTDAADTPAPNPEN